LLPPEYARHFPQLSDDNHHVTSAEETRYNCVAWAMGDQGRRWWSGRGKGWYWPTAAETDSVETFVDMLQTKGYERLAGGLDDAPGSRVALYADRGAVKHMAREVEPNWWTSKLAAGFDLRHRLDALERSLYGEVVAFFHAPS
jgi:hypothetical protein